MPDSILRRFVNWLVLFVGLSTFTCASEVDPREFGLDIPPGKLKLGNGKVVLTDDEDKRPVAAKVYAEVGEHRVVLLPNGQLVGRTAAAAPETDRPFEPATPDALMKQLVLGEFAGFRAKKTKHYVYVYNTSENFALVTSRILESMIPGMMAHAKQQKIDTYEPEVPLIAIMFRTVQEFQNFRRMPNGVVAYYHIATNQIVMYEESGQFRFKPELAIQQSISTIAHEGAHQILHNIGVQQRLSRWPMWISEGIAEYYAPTAFGKNLRWKGAGQVNDMRMLELEWYLKGRAGDAPSGEMISDTVAAAQLTSTGYAAAWSLTHFLAKTQKEAFHAYLRDVSKLGPFAGSTNVVEPGIIPENMRLFEQHFGGDLARIETGLVKHLKNQPYTDPFAEFPHYVAAIEVAGGRRPRREANLFHTEEMAAQWVVDLIGDLPADQRRAAQHTIREFPNRLIAEQFARQYLGPGK